jgi:hypothetical protein
VLLLTTAHRLPAPIQEAEETPAPAVPLDPSTKHSVPAKPTSSNGTNKSALRKRDNKTEETKISGHTPSSKARLTSTPLRSPFVGTWSGTINITIFGNIGYTFMVDSTQSTVTMWGTNNPAEIPNTKSDLCHASVGANGISWNWSAWKWTLTPYPDGRTALVKVEGPLQNASAVFQRRK